MTSPSTIAIGPCPVPPGVRSVLICGGTFDPPHRAHIELPSAAGDRLGSDWLLFVPAGRNPLKSDGPAASDQSRLAMLSLALQGVPNASISTCDLERAGPSYTVDTLRSLRPLLPPAASLRLLIGADQAATFHRWREPREIIRMAEPAVMLRAPLELSDQLLRAMRPHWTEPELDEWATRIVEVALIDISATELRELLRTGADPVRLNSLLSPGVLDYITSHALYRAPPS